MLLNSIQLSPVNLVHLLLIYSCAIGAVIFRRQPRYSGLLLAFILQILSLLCNLYEQTRTDAGTFLLSPAFTLMVGPSLFLFVRVLTAPQQPLSRGDSWHFLPALPALFLGQYVSWVVAFGALSQLCYLAVSLRLLQRYKHAVAQQHSDTQQFELNWLFRILVLLCLLILIEICRVNLQPLLDFTLRNLWYLADQVILLVLINGMLVGLIRQTELFNNLLDVEHAQQSPPSNDDAQAEAIFKQLDELVQQQQLFAIPRLSLNDVANHTGLSVKDISWAINQGGKQNFADYINNLRLKKLVTLARLKPDAALLTLALDAGFSSKSSFNAACKKLTGMSPTGYLTRPES